MEDIPVFAVGESGGEGCPRLYTRPGKRSNRTWDRGGDLKYGWLFFLSAGL